VRNALYGAEPAEAAWALNHITLEAELSGERERGVLNAFVPILVDVEHLVKLAELRTLARAEQMTALMRLLRCTTRTGHLLDRPSEEGKAKRRQAEGQQQTLGERRALARKPSRAHIKRLIDDPHPLVVRILLGNPRITEQDVIRMAARRPSPALVAVEIAKARVRSGRIRMAIIQNPGTPPAVSVPLLFLLSRPELNQVARAADLEAVVRATAQELYQLRPPLDGAMDSAAIH
jgi:hypothetical protein